MRKRSLIRRITAAAIAIVFIGSAAEVSAPKASVPALDKPKLEAYLRYAEGYSPQVQIKVDDLAPDPIRGYYRAVVHLSRDKAKLERVYYTPDGEHFINGTVWDLNSSPFLDTLQRLPTDGFSFGPTQAKVIIVLFSDFECPYCRRLASIIRDNVPRKYPSDVRVIFKEFPLESIHKWSRAAAEAGQCIGRQNQSAFWAWHDWVFQHQDQVNETNIRDNALNIAAAQHLDEAQIAGCIDNHATAPEIDESVKAGQQLQIQQTPTFFVNGRVINGAISWSTLDAIIQLELNRKANFKSARSHKSGA
jgi:protein-disulfide isomerase